MARAPQSSEQDAAKQNQTNSQTSFGNQNNALSAYQDQLTKALAGDPYKAGGEYSKEQTEDIGAGSAATQDSVKDQGENYAARTGENSANINNTLEDASVQRQRDLTASLRGADESRVASEQQFQQQGLQNRATLAAGYGSQYGTGISGAVGQYGNANNAAQANNAWWQGLINSGVGAAGAVAGAAVGKCWIAEALWGVNDARTRIVRRWINGPWSKTLTGRVVNALYEGVGREVAFLARHSSVVRYLLRPVFDLALLYACRDQSSQWQSDLNQTGGR